MTGNPPEMDDTALWVGSVNVALVPPVPDAVQLTVQLPVPDVHCVPLMVMLALIVRCDPGKTPKGNAGTLAVMATVPPPEIV
jgi:hypothetical protein